MLSPDTTDTQTRGDALIIRVFLANCVSGMTDPDVPDAERALDRLVAAVAALEHERDEARAEVERFRQRAEGIWNFLGPEGQNALIESGWHP